MNIAQVQLGEDVLICGRGFGTAATGATSDQITGSDNANDILEGGDYGRSNLNNLGGNDVLRGTLESDTLNGGAGDDVLVGRDGDDTLNGGSEKNSYLPGGGNDTVVGGSGLDVVFFNGNRTDYTLGNCNKTTCMVSGIDGEDTLENVEIIIFREARIDVAD